MTTKNEILTCRIVSTLWIWKKICIPYQTNTQESFNSYDGYTEVDIIKHNNTTFKSDIYHDGKVIADDLLSNGILYIRENFKNIFSPVDTWNRSVKIKIGVFDIKYEQTKNGNFQHSGYCEERL